MPAPEFRFSVYVIESPRADDIYDSRTEGAALTLAGKLDEIDVHVRYAVDRAHFEKSLTLGFYEIWNPDLYDFLFLHLSAHGDMGGIGLTDGTTVQWSELHTLLSPINQSTAGRLLLSLSACQGMNSIWDLAVTVDPERMPYAALISSMQSPTWSQTAIGYATLYHQMAIGNLNLERSVRAMNVASGHEFQWKSSHEAHQQFQEAVQRLAMGS